KGRKPSLDSALGHVRLKGHGCLISRGQRRQTVDPVEQAQNRANGRRHQTELPADSSGSKRPDKDERNGGGKDKINDAGNLLQQIVVRANVTILALELFRYMQLLAVFSDLVAGDVHIRSQPPALVIVPLVFPDEVVIQPLELFVLRIFDQSQASQRL